MRGVKCVSEAGGGRGKREEVRKWGVKCVSEAGKGEVCEWDRVGVCRVVCETVSHVCHLSGVPGTEDRRDGRW